ncbi:MAG: iron-sulfur cluster assembly protein, partial [Longimicrobiales bacterium]
MSDVAMKLPVLTQSSAGAEYPRTPLWDALREVRDPELPISIVDLGLVVAIRQQGVAVEVDLTYTAI